MIDAQVVVKWKIGYCPLHEDWRNWDIETWSKPLKVWVRLQNNENTSTHEKTLLVQLLDDICEINAKWEKATDDISQQTPPKDRNWMSGFPRHEHTELQIGKVLIHIDYLKSMMQGPTRGCTLYLIYLDGKLAGAGWYWGSTISFGIGCNSLPAKALIDEDLVLTVETRQKTDPKVTLWKSGPFGVA